MKGYRFPRTMDEAFGTDATSACAIEIYRAPRVWRWVWLFLAICAGLALWGLR